MEELRLPWNNREGLLYGGIISAITAFIMMTFNICKLNGGVETEYLVQSITALPLLWVVVMLIMTFFVGRIANMIVNRYSQPSDSLNAHIVMNIVCCVFMMSAIMTGVGPMVGGVMNGTLNLEGFASWPQNWPVNFCVAFWVEMALAQPAARMVMRKRHIAVLKARNAGGATND